MVNTKIRLKIFFAAKEGEALYSQQKQNWELTVAQIMNSMLPNSYLNWKKMWKPLDHSGMTYIKSLTITVEETNRFKGIYKTECLYNYEEWFLTLYRRKGSKSSPVGGKKKKTQKDKMVASRGLTNIWEKNRCQRQRRKGKITIWIQYSKE